jgi:hypothetical protein
MVRRRCIVRCWWPLPLLSPIQAAVMIGWAVAQADASWVVAALEVAASKVGEAAAQDLSELVAWAEAALWCGGAAVRVG